MTSLWLSASLSLALLSFRGSLAFQETNRVAEKPQNSSRSGQDSSNASEQLALHIETVRPDPTNMTMICLDITATNATDELLILRTFRSQAVDHRIVLIRNSAHVQQIGDSLNSLYRVSGIGLPIKPHSSVKERVSLSRLYKLEPGDYQAYVESQAPKTHDLVRSNVLSFSYTDAKK